jgi:oligoendopeptidase F
MTEKKQKNGAENVFWNLSDLYKSADDPAIEADKLHMMSLTDTFANSYRGKISGLDATGLATLLTEYEIISDTLGKLGSFAYLQWSTNTENAAYGKLLQSVTEFSSELSQKLVFFDVEWLAVDEQRANELIATDVLQGWRHFLESSRRYRDHILSEKEEQILTAKSVTGSKAWVRYFDETLGAARFDLDGEKFTEQEVLSKLHEPDRELRIRAADSLTEGFNQHKRTLTFVFNTLLADKATNDTLRKYPSWISARNLSNQITDEAVDTLVGSVVEHYPVVQRYYNLKRELLGYEALYEYDRYAPLQQNEARIQWDEARTMVLESFDVFHPEMGRIARRFFDENWIDAAIRPGKRGGAYSASTVPSVHPYVFMNFDGRLRDVQTLAHELGHGVHQYLSREQGVLQCDTPLTTAETASVFAEMLVFKKLLSRLDNPREKLALLTGKIDDTIATVFRQVSMNRFEHAIHTARRQEGELNADRFSALWRGTQQDLYGDSVILRPEYDLWWCYIPHFLHTPGYVYAYAFGELLVLSLYDRFEQGAAGFNDAYVDVLRAGGSDWPDKLISRLGVDITAPEFWNNGLGIVESLVRQAEELAASIPK